MDDDDEEDESDDERNVTVTGENDERARIDEERERGARFEVGEKSSTENREERKEEGKEETDDDDDDDGIARSNAFTRNSSVREEVLELSKRREERVARRGKNTSTSVLC